MKLKKTVKCVCWAMFGFVYGLSVAPAMPFVYAIDAWRTAKEHAL